MAGHVLFTIQFLTERGTAPFPLIAFSGQDILTCPLIKVMRETHFTTESSGTKVEGDVV